MASRPEAECVVAQGDSRVQSGKDDDGLEILPPDHPLMKHFQDALRDHLQRQNDHLTEEVFQLEAQGTKQERLREELGERLYDAQQELQHQLSLLDTCHASLASATEARVHAEEAAAACRSTHRVQVDKLTHTKNTEEELRSELEGLALLLDQFTRWEQQMESDLSVSQRITEKAAKDKMLLANEKRKQDQLILRSMGEVSRLRRRAELLDAQLELKEEEGAELGQLVADGSADLLAVQQEQHRLVRAWGCAVANLQHHDRVLEAARRQLWKLRDDFSSLNCEIESFKKSAEDEMVKNEKLTLLLKRHEAQVREAQRQLDAESDKKSRTEAQLSSFADVLSATEEGLQESVIEQRQLEREDRCFQQEAERLRAEKVQLEDVVLDTLRQQGSHDKTAQHINRLVVQLRERNRAQERDIVSTENEQSKLCLAVEQQKVWNRSQQQLLSDLQHEVSAGQQHFRQLEKELSKVQVAVAKKQSSIHALNKKLEAVTSKTGNEDKSPSELKIAELTQTIVDTTESSDKLQQLWLRQQAHIVQLSHKATEQFHHTDMLRKQVVVKEQSNLQLEKEVASLELEERELGHSIHTLLNKLTSLNSCLYERRGYKDTLDRNNTFTSGQYLGYLKECEGAYAELQMEMEDLRLEKERLSRELINLQRESLAWEKKLQMAVETKQSIAREQSSLGDIGSMKCEIHRMEVRFSQLRKVQERLAQDLEHCVSRRSAIVGVAQVQEKRAARGAHAMRASLHKQLDDLCSRIKHALAEVKSTEWEMGREEHRQQELLQQLTEEQERLELLHKQATLLEQQLQDGWLAKQKNLELLVSRQRKLRMLEDVCQGRHKLLFRNEARLTTENQRQSTIRGHLISILESLLADFPTLKLQFSHIFNYLHL